MGPEAVGHETRTGEVQGRGRRVVGMQLALGRQQGGPPARAGGKLHDLAAEREPV